MRALVNAPGTDGGIEHRDISEPDPSPDEAVVAVHAFALNRGELRLLAARPDGWRPGQDVAGTIVRSAADGTGPDEGTRVVAWVEQAGWAERVAAPTSRVAQLPDSVTFAAAAALPVAGITALRALRLGGLLLGRRVLVTGAAGGVGRFAVELAARSGATVTGVAAGAGRAEGLAELGATDVVHDIGDASGPFDLILESAGGPSLSAAIRLVGPDGTVVIFGNSSGQPAELSFGDLAGAPRAKLYSFRVYESGEPPSFGEDLQRLVSLVASDQLHPQVGYEADWQDVATALELLRDRRVNGKAVLRVD